MPKGVDNSATGNTQNPSGSTKVTWGLRSKRDSVGPESSLHTFYLPTNRSRNDSIFIIVATSAVVDLSTPTGFIFIKSIDKKLHVFYKECTGLETDTYTSSSSASCKILCTSLIYYGLAKDQSLSFAFNNSSLNRTLTPMPSVTNAFKNGILISAVMSWSNVTWNFKTSGTTEISDYSHSATPMSLAVSNYESLNSGASSLIEAEASAATASVSITLSVNSTGIETYIIGNPYSSADDNKIIVVESNNYSMSVFSPPSQNSWLYRSEFFGGKNTSTNSDVVGVFYDISSSNNKPSSLIAYTKKVSLASAVKTTASSGDKYYLLNIYDPNQKEIKGFAVSKDKKIAAGVLNGSGKIAINAQSFSSGDMSVYIGSGNINAPTSNVNNSVIKTSNQGHLTFATWAEVNVEPEPPLLLSPSNASHEISLNPVFTGEFRDFNGYYGYTSGQGNDRGDYITKYNIKIRKKSVAESISNGYFETDASGWGNEVKSTGLTTSITRDTSTKFAGTASLKVDVLTNTSGVSGTYIIIDHLTDLNVTFNRSYTLSWKGYSRTTAMEPNMRIVWLGKNNTIISYSDFATWESSATYTWQNKSITSIAPENALKMRIQLYVKITNTSSQGSVNYDNISIEPTVILTESFLATDAEKNSNKFSTKLSTLLENNTEYEWSAQTADAFGEWGAWSSWKDFFVALTGPLTAMSPNEYDIFGREGLPYYQITNKPDFTYKWESGNNTPMYKFDFELSTYSDFRDSDPYKKKAYGITYGRKISSSTTLNAIGSINQNSIYLSNNGNIGYTLASETNSENIITVLKIDNEYMLLKQINHDDSPKEFIVERGYFASPRGIFSSGSTVEIYEYQIKKAWTSNDPIMHTLSYSILKDSDGPLLGLDINQKYYWRMRGYDINNIPSVWSEGQVNPNNSNINNVPAVYTVDQEEIAKLRTNSHRYRLYFCVWDTWKFYSTYPRLTWVKGSDPRNPDNYTADLYNLGEAPYEIRFPVETPSDQINVNVQQSGFAILGEYGEEDFKCVVNIGSNRLAFADEPIVFSAKKSWTRGNNPGFGWSASLFEWTFEGATNLPTAIGPGPFNVWWSSPGLYTVSCSYNGQPAVSRKVRVYQDRNTIDYDVVDVGNISGSIDGGWTTSIVIKQQLGNIVAGNLNNIQEYQSVGIFCEEEWEVNGEWIRDPISFYDQDQSCLITGYIQNGSIKIDANTHTFSFNINPVSEQLKLVTMYGTQTWSQAYYKNVALVATPNLIPQGSTISFNPMYLIDVVLHVLQNWTNVLERHDFFGWYDTSLQARDTVSTNEGAIWSSLTNIAEAEYAWLFTDPGNGIHFEPNPSLRSWGVFNDYHPVSYILDQQDIWNIDVQQKLMNVVNYCQVTGTRPYYPNSIFEGKYPGTIPEGVLGQWLIKSGQLFSSQWFADYMAENFYWDANRKITASIIMGMNRKIHVPGRVFINLEIPERDIYFDAKEFYVTSAGYSLSAADSKFTSSFQLIENMKKSSGITGVRKNINADTYINGTEITLSANAAIITNDNNIISITNLAQAVTAPSYIPSSTVYITNINVVNSAGMSAGSLLKIDNEIMLIISINGNTVTVQGAFAGTSAASHTFNATVKCIAYFKDHNIDMSARGHIGQVDIKLIATYHLMWQNTHNVDATAHLIKGNYEIASTGVILWPDETMDMSATASVQKTFELSMNATWHMLFVKTRSMIADYHLAMSLSVEAKGYIV